MAGRAARTRGFHKLRSGDNLGAISDYNEALRLDPGDASAWAGRGRARSSLGSHQEALADLEEALRLAPESEPNKVQLNEILRKAEDTDERSIGGFAAETDAAETSQPLGTRPPSAGRRCRPPSAPCRTPSGCNGRPQSAPGAGLCTRGGSGGNKPVGTSSRAQPIPAYVGFGGSKSFMNPGIGL